MGFVAAAVGSVAATPSAPPTQVSAGTPATAAQPSTTPIVITAQSQADTPQVKGSRDMNRVICRTRPVLGSRLNKQRECRTAADWERLRTQATNGADKATRGMSGGMVTPGN